MTTIERQITSQRFPDSYRCRRSSRAPAPHATAEALIPESSQLRYEVSDLHDETTRLSRAVYVAYLNERTTRCEQMKVQTLLQMLVATGLSWTTLARALGVSVPAIRKWRLGEGVSPENRHAVARLPQALLEILEQQLHIEDPASWLEIPLAGTRTTLADIYARGREDLVIDYASTWISTAQELLDQTDPWWRAKTASREFETFESPDGEMALRRVQKG